ncbi:response regulator [Litorilinea aerophila]|uniref:Response regulator n=1 Tax=Litorilinea aerophila TaxID=1204385 RepID=A0A540VFG3_9CHLR|nr:response regulator [Litorilinea aerophila]MCC9076752.1 response regulator [Litorilinea aerophila]OUC05131.1 hypothetical protein RY27_29125 [Litorilinea aerophila]
MDLTDKNILVVEDNLAFLEVLRDVLEMEGYTVHVALNAAEGHSLIQGMRVDLLITDMLLPDGNGADLIAALQERSPATKIVAMSASTFHRVGPEQAAQDLGVDRVLAKPFDLDTLLDLVAELLSAGSTTGE